MPRHITPVVIGIICKDGKFLLTQRADERSHPWQFPGGGLEFGESVEDCLHRELKEEIGIAVDIITLLPKIYHEVRGRWEGIFPCFLCVMKDSSAKIVINDEACDYGWYTLPEIRKLHRLPHTYEMAKIAERNIQAI